ncbi:hypothetical protein KBZ19_09820 [Synechococcus sp. L2F]|uniref:hypothetical protein n=1 Tax=Synechococcus sp. L2F TaxID=2823739 RepID=UPI0020CCE60C|nr:hypothetical protein [Synechococcus sp. L2F]MCP9828782.1 hypothetical protein [Synechococcus sp. L2F]
MTPLEVAAADARWILPVRPLYAGLIRSGRKNCELRSYSAGIAAGDWVLLYSRAPVSAITAAIRIGAVEQHCPDRLWTDPGPHRLGVTATAWQRAFASVPTIWLHTIASVVELPRIGRAELTDRWPGWRPLQRVQRRSPAAWLEPVPVRPAPTRDVQLLLAITFAHPSM